MARLWPEDVRRKWPQSKWPEANLCRERHSEDSNDEEPTLPEYDPGFHLTLYLVGEELGDDGSTNAASTGGLNVVLQTLPEEVVEEVLVRLPASAQARGRAVCKAWLAMLDNPEFSRRSFRQALSRTTPPPLCAFRFWPEEYYYKPYYSPEDLRPIPPMYKALKVDLSFLPEAFQSWASELHNSSPSGFMCFSRCVEEGMHVCVVNPVNQSFKVLPLLENLWSHRVILLMGAVTATEIIPSFKVYVPLLGPVPKLSRPIPGRLLKDVAIYSSTSGEWKDFAEISKEPPVVCNGDLYRTVDGDLPRLLQVSTGTGAGHLRNLALPHFESHDWKTEFVLAGHAGRLLCCCGGIWMLDDARHLWVEVAGMCPPDILTPGNPETQSLRLKNLHVAGDLVVFFYQLCFHRRGHRKVDCPVAYDMLRRYWRKVPQSMAQVGDVFQPMLNLRL